MTPRRGPRTTRLPAPALPAAELDELYDRMGEVIEQILDVPADPRDAAGGGDATRPGRRSRRRYRPPATA
ncbi:MAG TPA: hypothetical protein VMY42_23795 [Thermoguttaceae bacterium]|nr:hypothetical protein [Thermoguttaceae bacterium]